jgi:predicted metal-dependent hydrolase
LRFRKLFSQSSKSKTDLEQRQIKLSDISIDVVYKNIKNIHLAVLPPNGRVRITSPKKFSLDFLQEFAVSKLNWIKKHQQQIQMMEKETPREYITGETHYYLGKRYLLNVVYTKSASKVILNHSTIDLFVRKNSSVVQRQKILIEWYRERLKEIIPDYITRLEKTMNVKVNEFGVKRMKTRWGTCNIRARRIWMNLELAKKPMHCIELIIVHEMTHLLERNHNERFYAYMTKFLPQWKESKKELKHFPLVHTEWEY